MKVWTRLYDFLKEVEKVKFSLIKRFKQISLLWNNQISIFLENTYLLTDEIFLLTTTKNLTTVIFKGKKNPLPYIKKFNVINTRFLLTSE